jgi:hypothetical protein
MSDNPPRERGTAHGREREFSLNVVSRRHCVACNSCRARFRRVGATCESCGADLAVVGVMVLPLTATDRLFAPDAKPRRPARRWTLGFWRLARIRH